MQNSNPIPTSLPQAGDNLEDQPTKAPTDPGGQGRTGNGSAANRSGVYRSQTASATAVSSHSITTSGQNVSNGYPANNAATVQRESLDLARTADKTRGELLAHSGPHSAQEVTVEVESLSNVRKILAFGDRLRRTNTLEELLDTAVGELFRVLKANRVSIFQFVDGERGKILAEAMTPGYTPTLGTILPAIAFGGDFSTYLQSPLVEIDTENSQFSPYQQQLVEQFQVKSSLSLPIVFDDRLWGLLVVQQCDRVRQWQDAEVILTSQVATELMLGLQPVEFQATLDEQREREKLIAKLLANLQQSSDIDSIFQTVTLELRQLLNCDRVGIYKFYPDWSGELVAESVGSGWPSIVKLQDSDDKLKQDLMSSDRCLIKNLDAPRQVGSDTYLKDTKGGLYMQGKPYSRVDDIREAGFSACYLESLEKFQCRAYINVPVFLGDKLWGLLAAYQNDGPREWGDDAVNLVVKVAQCTAIAIQKVETIDELAEKVSQEELVGRLLANLQQTTDAKTIFSAVTQDTRKLLNADRVGIYKFYPDWSGELVAESVGPGWPSIVDLQQTDSKLKQDLMRSDRCLIKDLNAPQKVGTDTYLKDTKGGLYMQGKPYSRVDDIREAGFSACYLESLEKFQCRAYINVPIFHGEKLWGLLAVYQNDGPRDWGDDAVNLVLKIAKFVAISLQKSETFNQLTANAEREKLVSRAVSKIQIARDEKSIFQAVTQDMRQLLKVDRVGVYMFYPDWSGELVAESVGPGWPSIVDLQERDDALKKDLMSSDRCLIKDLNAPRKANADTYLKDTKGGLYMQGKRFSRVDDIYEAGFSPCYLESLEKFQCRAYINVPIFQGDKLWGLLAVYQNSGPRTWQDDEVNVVLQISNFLAIGLEKLENIAQLERKTQQEQLIAKVAERLRQTADLPQVLQASARDIRQLLNVDRVGLFQFSPESNYTSGEFVVEDVSEPRYSAMAAKIQDHCFVNQVENYRKGRTWIVPDVNELGDLEDCLVQVLSKLQIKASMLMPLVKGDVLWGLFAIHKCDGPRQWDDSEVDFARRIAGQLNIALQQADYLETVQTQSEQLAESAKREKVAKEEFQQQAVQLLTAVRPALQGDLTVRAPITETEVGTIASAYNSTLQSLRAIVVQVQAASSGVAETSQASGTAIAKVATQAEKQLEAIGEAIAQLQGMVVATDAMTANAGQVNEAVEQANQTVRAGDSSMDRTVESISAIRETVAETSKRIKRLSESSQKISKVVSLIENFTTQTHLLSLNAAIEATRAGEYGRGFAVVADEVRSLARQSATATTEIAALVEEIQAGTVEVSNAMDSGIHQVVEGTNLVNDARRNLNEIVRATEHIRQLGQGIAAATQSQTTQSQLVTLTMNEVAEIASQTSADTTELSASFEQVLATAQDLQSRANQFKVD
ncbi:GAF domain-containing protein [Synechococcus sp. PCC 7336]|uniref:GAF domain-containing protein n=1 Tax=Synechococcus sp. PCC 7336 TaxID=195250 RepID=UPI000344F15D|nr:GAF domain-containing protein [Synechococcus sp. PCC 7336]